MPEHDAEQYSAADEELRSLLADLADVGPLPAEVESRLDETLARLAAARESSGVVDIAALRRRRRWTMGLAAAASASIVAVGLGALSTNSAVLGGAVSEKADAPTRGGVPQSDSSSGSADGVVSPGAESDFGPDRPVPTPVTASGGRGTGSQSVAPAFTSARFAQQVEAWLADADARAYAWSGACPVSGVPTSARLFAATFDGVPAALVVLPPRDGFQTIAIADCSGKGRLLDSTQVAVR